jgi:hypothetical protein
MKFVEVTPKAMKVAQPSTESAASTYLKSLPFPKFRETILFIILIFKGDMVAALVKGPDDENWILAEVTAFDIGIYFKLH